VLNIASCPPAEETGYVAAENTDESTRNKLPVVLITVPMLATFLKVTIAEALLIVGIPTKWHSSKRVCPEPVTDIVDAVLFLAPLTNKKPLEDLLVAT
jgi:hypothetical protein